MGALDYSAIVIALIAFFSARSSARTSAKASKDNARVVMEEEAYIRARKFDTETIDRQDKEIDELQAELLECKRRLKECESARDSKE